MQNTLSFWSVMPLITSMLLSSNGLLQFCCKLGRLDLVFKMLFPLGQSCDTWDCYTLRRLKSWISALLLGTFCGRYSSASLLSVLLFCGNKRMELYHPVAKLFQSKANFAVYMFVVLCQASNFHLKLKCVLVFVCRPYQSFCVSNCVSSHSVKSGKVVFLLKWFGVLKVQPWWWIFLWRPPIAQIEK